MKVKFKTLTESDERAVENLAKETGLSYSGARILFLRGINSADGVRGFLNPSKANFNDPHGLKGIDAAIERLKKARDNNETVVVYGDYDADGICAATVMVKSLKIFGINASAVVPERENGYGLSVEVIDEVVETYLPDLIVTVDCGISGVKEVEYLKDLGVDVIITDHHEIPDVTPDAIIVNCKFKDQSYPFSGLCGAGVAYKIACALIGGEADKFLDVVALATVADSMPVTGENRDIIHEGVKIMKAGKSLPAIKALLELSGAKEINETSLAFALAPRVNAAGRMGDAYSALKLFLSEDKVEIKRLAETLVKYNVLRQSECDALYKQAKQELKGKKIDRLVLVCGEDYKSGLVGIVTARLAEEYYLPAIIFSGRGGVLHGSARSIDGVNIYKAVDSAKDLVEDFGGHSQAAGITIKKENLPAFYERVNGYLKTEYGDEVFERTIEAEEEISGKFPLKLAKEISSFEPFGTGNKRPLYAMEAGRLTPNPIRQDSVHLTIKSSVIDLTYFNGLNDAELLKSDVKKQIVFEPNISEFNGKEYLKGYVKAVVLSYEFGKRAEFDAMICGFKKLGEQSFAGYKTVSVSEADEIVLKNIRGFGKLFVLTDIVNLKKYKNATKLELNYKHLSTKGGKNCLILGGISLDDDISEYNEIIYLDKPFAVYKYAFVSSVTVADLAGFNLDGVDPSRTNLGAAFVKLKLLIAVKDYQDYYDLYLDTGIDEAQFAFAVAVFTELGFLSDLNRIAVNAKTKNELTNSAAYRAALDEKSNKKLS